MTTEHLPQLAAAAVATVTPWIVVQIAWRTAGGFAAASGHRLERPSSARRVARATIALLPLVALAALLLPAPSPWMFAVDGVGFALPAALALAALGDLEQRSRSFRRVGESKRSASLRPRRAGEHLPWSWRVAASAASLAALGAFVVRVLAAPPSDRVLVPATFACAAAVFLWLYEVRIQELAEAPVVEGLEGDDDLGRRIRGAWALELALVFAGVGAAHALLGLDWARSGLLGAGISLAAGLLGVVGCGVLIASGLAERSYATADR